VAGGRFVALDQQATSRQQSAFSSINADVTGGYERALGRRRKWLAADA
jgi:hypothetical protein